MVTALYFSPVGSTETIAKRIASGLLANANDLNAIDVTLPAAREKVYEFTKDDVVVIASPTYAGRIPNKIMPFFKDNIKGNGAKCVIAASFGNRSCDNVLIEHYNLANDNGFEVLGAGAFVARHVMSEIMAVGRPDEDDFAAMDAFAAAVKGKLDDPAKCTPLIMNNVLPNYYTPLKMDGTRANFLKAKPIIDEEKCTKCGTCAKVCPVGSVSAEDFSTPGVCIKCHACIRKCPAGAKYFDDPDKISHVQFLDMAFGKAHTNNSWFV